MNAITINSDVKISGSPVDRLRDIARRCQAGQPLDPGHSLWLAKALNDYLEKATDSLEEAMGLRYGRGGMPWWREAAMRERDAALRALAEAYFSDLSTCARSRQIATLAKRYDASAWRIDRERDEMPEHYAGKPQELLWLAFKSGATMPLGERQVRNIVAL